MTVKELKIEADKLGYSIIKKKAKPKMLPCICGCKRREHWYLTSSNMRVLVCKKCGISIAGKDEVDAIKKWNQLIKEKLK